MVEKLIPESADYIVLKPKHSAFYATPLDTLLMYLKAMTIILTGLTRGSCILITPGELYIRDLKIFDPPIVSVHFAKELSSNLLNLTKLLRGKQSDG